KPVYQHVVLRNLQLLWNPAHRSALDVGGGTGVMAHTVKTLFALERVATVDVVDRFLASLDVETSVYDGATLPFADGSFDCVLLFNVLHHVPVGGRVELLRACPGVARGGPIYIKGPLSPRAAHKLRHSVFDLTSKTPFGGIV